MHYNLLIFVGICFPSFTRCAAYLNDLCQTAITEYDRYSHYDISKANEMTSALPYSIAVTHGTSPDFSLPRGFIVDYASMPGIYPRHLMQFFGISITTEIYRKIFSVSSQYSKARAWYYPKAGVFAADTSDKNSRASDKILQWSDRIMNQSYLKLSVLAVKSNNTVVTANKNGRVREAETSSLSLIGNGDDGRVNWAALRMMPSLQTSESIDSELYTADSNFISKIYNPFSTTINSSYFEVS
jgi:hypothetical protein